jgi:3-deoxy-D-manno-octulosonic-acid transferase
MWYIHKLIGKLTPIVFYCGDPLDHFVFAPVNQYLSNVVYVTDKAHVRLFLQKQGIICKNMPVFPKAVIMARHATHKFPVQEIVKIGMRHGAYHFKRMTSAENYNSFDLYLMTSIKDVEAGNKVGITSAKAVGFPKLDTLFTEQSLSSKTIQPIHSKPIVMFTATYTASKMSAIDIWLDRLYEIQDKYIIHVSLHPWIRNAYKNKLHNQKGIVLIDAVDTLTYLKSADVVIGDTSSILAEACALDKPMITFRLPSAKRSLTEIEEILSKISYQVNSFDELKEKIEYAINNKDELHNNRREANRIFFDELDGKASLRASQEIINLLKSRSIN